jgi:hypothetical protein
MRRTTRRRSKSPGRRGATPGTPGKATTSRADKIREAARALLPTLRELERDGTQVHGPITGGFHGNTYYELDDTLYTVNEEEVVADEPNCGPQKPYTEAIQHASLAARALLPSLRELMGNGTQVHGPDVGAFRGNTYYELDGTLYTVFEEKIVASGPMDEIGNQYEDSVPMISKAKVQLVWVLAALIAVWWWWLRSSSTDHASAIGASSPTPAPLHAGGVVERAGV